MVSAVGRIRSQTRSVPRVKFAPQAEVVEIDVGLDARVFSGGDLKCEARKLDTVREALEFGRA
eukprot:1994965-Alexandrium_andersonii.AAC.1